MQMADKLKSRRVERYPETKDSPAKAAASTNVAV